MNGLVTRAARWSAVALVTTLLGAASAGCEATPPAVTGGVGRLRERSEARAPTEKEVLSGALESVVLVVTSLPNGTTGYGAGILLEPSGLLLTNHHVVANATSVRVLFYDKRRPSYVPTEGGLMRFAFEHESELASARTERTNATLDLAVLRVARDTSRMPKLALRNEPVKVGEPVYALGHPAEALWSFTSGLVSAVREGMIQTDAAINHGNSGGPLIDTSGRIVGINTIRLERGVQSIAFARPVELAMVVVSEQSTRGVDRSTPELAWSNCNRAMEMGLPEAIDCFSLDGLGDVDAESIRRAGMTLRMSPEQLAWLEKFIPVVQNMVAGAVDRAVKVRLGQVSGERAEQDAESDGLACAKDIKLLWASFPQRQEFVRRTATRRALDKAIRTVDASERAQEERAFKRCGMKRVTSTRKNSLKLLRNMVLDSKSLIMFEDEIRRAQLGRRLEGVKIADSGQVAWLVVAGRNEDGTVYRCSEPMRRINEAWAWPNTLTPDEQVSLPHDFPNASDDAEADKVEREARIIKKLLDFLGPKKSGAAYAFWLF